VSNQGVKNSDLVEIAKRNGDFRKNYGPWLGAFLYLRSIQTAAGYRSVLRPGWLAVIASLLLGAWRLMGGTPAI
jgi:hypothetical protein